MELVYVYQDGEPERILAGTPDGVTELIARMISASTEDLLFVNAETDEELCDTFGCFLNRIDPDFRNILMPKLLPYQMGEKELNSITFKEADDGMLVNAEALDQYNECLQYA